MNGYRRFGLAVCVSFFSCLALTGRGDTTVWIGATGSWFEAGNWDNGLPAAGRDVLLAGGVVLLDAETPALNLFEMTGGTLVFSNWTTRLNATNVTLAGGLVTLPPAFTTAQMSNRVWFACEQDFLLAAGAQIQVQGRGYFQGQGPGKATGVGGGGYGGAGGIVGGLGGPAYGPADVPEAPGSGGGSTPGGNGGGAVRIEAGGAVTVNGAINANGNNSTHSGGGGAGGAVYIRGATFGGSTNGLITAAGGDGCWWGGYQAYLGYGGGGGRIAIDYDSLAGTPGVRFVASKGPDNADQINIHLRPRAAEMGTLWLPDAAFLSESMGGNLFKDVRLVIPGFSAWSPGTLSVSNCAFIFDQPLDLTVTNSLQIAKGYVGVRGNVTVQNGNLELENGGTLHVYAMPTNGSGPDYGALLLVGGDLVIKSNGWLNPYADRTNGAAVLMCMQNLLIETNGGINADGKGFQDYKGPGAVGIAATGGAGHGGLGNAVNSVAGPIYGSLENPVLPGSGGGLAIYGGFGGGVVRLAVSNTATVHGLITANGLGNLSTGAGCGSGGAINIACQTFGGNGLLSAWGGSGLYEYTAWWYGGAGGGGRIAVQYAALGTPRAIRFNTSRGQGHERKNPHLLLWAARDGTLWLSDTNLLSNSLDGNLFTGVRLFIPGFTAWSVAGLTVSNCSVTLPDTGFELTVNGDLTIGPKGSLGVAGPVTVADGDMTLTNGGALYVYAFATNGAPGEPGATVSVDGDVVIGPGSWIYPQADEAGGGAVRFVMQNLMVATNAGFEAEGRGFSRGRGPGGRGNAGAGGGGYGGRGGNYGAVAGGTNYGVAHAPLLPGSAGGYGGSSWQVSGFGGGLVWIEAVDKVVLDGTLSAGGCLPSGYGGAGAGGGILVNSASFQGGATAVMKADGKNGPYHSSAGWMGGEGGGGRIAVWRKVTPLMREALIASQTPPEKTTFSAIPFASYLGTVSVTNGTGWGTASVATNDEGQVGTVLFLEQLPPRGVIILIQ